jgi:hypothetical protein
MDITGLDGLTATAAPTAPEPPNRWPISDLVALIINLSA